MNPLSLIPAQYQLAARLIAIALVAFACASAGWLVRGWKDGTTIANLKTDHAMTVADARGRTLAAQAKADADHDKQAADLAASSAAHHEDLTRSEHANDLLRADVAAGTRIVRVAAVCPSRPADLPQAGAGGRVDPAASAVLPAAAGQAVLDLRASIIATEHQLAACQDAVKRMTGQGTP